ncbi:hypothetical protein J5N97_013704 [Dioscorea zingiberensis]|uniref:Uncharacterized protein n=1 Tax=Dioscorea zingiberensis TaxID=325984 RepID=A0A9D5CR27_9LILI|nr:hypothetical protein J5N97_013704 [Dioscorea zingiberensis]
MVKDFNVPPVVFPTSGAIPTAVPHQRRSSPAPSAPPFNPSPTLPFMSFDIGSTHASSSFSTPNFPSVSGSFSSLDDEPPLLEELGINTRQIWLKTTSILNPVRINPGLHEDADLFGPFLFLMAFGLFQLLSGKFHFGIILGWVNVASLFLYVVFNMLAGRNASRVDCVRMLACLLALLSARDILILWRGIATVCLENLVCSRNWRVFLWNVLMVSWSLYNILISFFWVPMTEASKQSGQIGKKRNIQRHSKKVTKELARNYAKKRKTNEVTGFGLMIDERTGRTTWHVNLRWKAKAAVTGAHLERTRQEMISKQKENARIAASQVVVPSSQTPGASQISAVASQVSGAGSYVSGGNSGLLD